MWVKHHARSMDLKVLAFIALPLIGGLLSAISMQKWQSWYASLPKPVWNPPSWLFGPAWTVLYILMGIASYLVWRTGDKLALCVYALQLAVNFAWSPVFFSLKRPDMAFIILVVLWFLIIATLILFFNASTVAGWLLVPYLLWVTYAGTLNGFIVYKKK